MLEVLINPKNAERKPWHMFFIGILYATISLILVSLIFSKDFVLSNYGGLLVVIFTVMFSLPFMYYLIKYEEDKDVEISESGRLIKEHSRALWAFMWLFLGLILAFSLAYIIFPQYNSTNFNAQIKVFCAINSPANFDYCIEEQGISAVTGSATRQRLVMDIFANNIYVLIFTIIFSLIFGAGAIFILVWNASVISAAIGIFFKTRLLDIISGARFPLSVLRYMIHGFPEIAAYFIGALAGGIISVSVIRKDLRGERTWKILQDALLLVIIAIIILFLAAIVEVYITPQLF